MIGTLRERYTIVIVTHNMAQARRASDECLFMLMGKLVEHGRTEDVFLNPREKETEMYIQGRYG
jgi:phosphate transport system ATP-binding protein